MKANIDANGHSTVTEELPDNPNGTRAVRSWSIPPEQVGKHEKEFRSRLSEGDADALRDVAREAERKAKR